MLEPNISESTNKSLLISNLLRSVSSLEGDDNKFSKIEQFISSKDSVGITAQEFVEMLKRANISDENSKGLLLHTFICSENRSLNNSNEFVKLINDFELKDNSTKARLLNSFLETKTSSEVTPEEFVKMIKGVNIDEDSEDEKKTFKIQSLQFFVRREKFKVSDEIIAKMIMGSEVSDDKSKINLYKLFLKDDLKIPHCKYLDIEFPSEVVKIMENIKDADKNTLFRTILKNPAQPKLNLEDFACVLNEIPSKNAENILSLYQIKFNNPNNYVKDCIYLATTICFDGVEEKSNLIKKFVEQIKKNSSSIDFDDALNLIKAVSGPNSRVGDCFDLANQIYSGKDQEDLKLKLIKESISLFEITAPTSNNESEKIKLFISNLQENKNVEELMQILRDKNIIKDEKDALSYVREKDLKLPKEFLKQDSLDNYITSQGIDQLKINFGDDLKVNNKSITYSDLMNYYESRGEISTLFSITKETKKQELRSVQSRYSPALLKKSTPSTHTTPSIVSCELGYVSSAGGAGFRGDQVEPAGKPKELKSPSPSPSLNTLQTSLGVVDDVVSPDLPSSLPASDSRRSSVDFSDSSLPALPAPDRGGRSPVDFSDSSLPAPDRGGRSSVDLSDSSLPASDSPGRENRAGCLNVCFRKAGGR